MSSSKQPAHELDDSIDFDPSYLNSLRELKFVGAIGCLALAWTIGYGGFYGYVSDGESTDLVFGMPSWVAWGVAVPWGVTSLVTLWFAIFIIREDDDDLLDIEAENMDVATNEGDRS